MIKKLLCVGLIFFTLFANGQEDRTRTRVVDYTKYDALAQGGIYYAPDKFSALKMLIEEIEKNFTPEDEEYFYGYRMTGLQYQQLYSFKESIDCLQKALDAYEKHFPFYHRGYSMVNKDFVLSTYLDLARSFRSFNLADKAINYLEFRRAELEHASVAIQLQYHSELALALLAGEQYGKAIDESLKLKAMVDSGEQLIDMQPADSIYKIDDNFPAEAKAAMLKAKEQYIKGMKAAEEGMASTQRLMYNSALSQAYFKQFQFKESIPYSQAWLQEYATIMKNADASMAASIEQMGQLPDSTQRLIKESLTYTKLIQEVGGWATPLIISACKENQKALALSYATGNFDKAVYHQLEGNTDEAEKNYQAAFAALNKTSQFKFYNFGTSSYDALVPWYINLHVRRENFIRAYEESIRLITKEEDNLRKSFQFFSESEKKEFFKAYNQKLDKFYSLLLLMTDRKTDKTEEMLNKVFQTKGLVFDVTREQERRLKKISDEVTLTNIRTVRFLRDKLSAFYQASTKSPSTALMDSINRYSIRINELERKINEKLGASANFLKPISWRDVQRKLKTDEVHLEIVRVLRDNFNFDKPIVQYWAFAIRQGDEKPLLIKLSERETFENRDLRNYQNRIKIMLDDNDSYNTYWAILENALSGKRKIFLSSDGVYHMINPLTLKNPATGNYLLQEVALTRLSTGRDLLMDHTSPVAANTSVALIGNPAFDISRKNLVNPGALKKNVDESYDRIEHTTRSGFSELPGTQEELGLIKILATSRGFRAKTLTGAQANEAQVKELQSPGVLHVATHGEFDQQSKVESFLKSKLVLAGAADDDPIPFAEYGKYEDGFLTAYEVVQLSLENTNLVVLSACETGLGEIQSGEGVWGLQRAFQMAGAKAVMGSLWKISDDATVEFMQQFYTAYFNGKNVAEAYVVAMKSMVQKYPQPYFWGAFVVTGG